MRTENGHDHAKEQGTHVSDGIHPPHGEHLPLMQTKRTQTHKEHKKNATNVLAWQERTGGTYKAQRLPW